MTEQEQLAEAQAAERRNVALKLLDEGIEYADMLRSYGYALPLSESYVAGIGDYINRAKAALEAI